MYGLYEKVRITATNEIVGTGWLPRMPDLRDYTDEHPEISAIVKELSLKGPLQKTIDIRQWFSPVEDQKQLGSCTANACVGIIEYFEKRAFNKYIDGSRLFVYKTTRNLLQVTGDTGALLRDTMAALTLLGVPDEKYWPYTDKNPDFDIEPPSFIYALANNYKAVKYFCHDPQGANIPTANVLASIKQYLAAGIPSMFGFWGFPSFNQSDVVGGIPYPDKSETAQWGHAIVAVGYDDTKKITNKVNGQTTIGALLIRNSWGQGWGEAGYGWMPYDYVLNKLALDFWSLLSMTWINTGAFGNKE